ncbi:MAG TPA: hypothetical protein VL984_11165 [Acidimicrobiales bacterium]|nr:hypothetical protein [Acidimicrobiales bacterium]
MCNEGSFAQWVPNIKQAQALEYGRGRAELSVFGPRELFGKADPPVTGPTKVKLKKQFGEASIDETRREKIGGAKRHRRFPRDGSHEVAHASQLFAESLEGVW